MFIQAPRREILINPGKKAQFTGVRPGHFLPVKTMAISAIKASPFGLIRYGT